MTNTDNTDVQRAQACLTLHRGLQTLGRGVLPRPDQIERVRRALDDLVTREGVSTDG